METNEVRALIMEQLIDARIEIQGADCSFTARVVSESFEGMRPVQRQQKVLSCFSEQLADGRLHALTVEAFTPAELAARENGLTQLTL